MTDSNENITYPRFQIAMATIEILSSTSAGEKITYTTRISQLGAPETSVPDH